MVKDIKDTIIILIGPMRAGKSTLGKLIADKLKFRQASLDSNMEKFLLEVGFDSNKYEAIRKAKGLLAVLSYVRQYSLPFIEYHLDNNKYNCVIDFGAGHSVFRNKVVFEKLKNLLEPYKNVILILPSQNLVESKAILKERTKGIKWLEEIRDRHGFDMNERYLTHKSNYLLAKFIVYTEGKTPDQTADEIINLIL